MPKLIYTLDIAAPLLELAARALTILRVQEFARSHGLPIEGTCGLGRRDFLLAIPLDELNGILHELHVEGLLLDPVQPIMGRPAAHIVLEEQFATLTWIDSDEDDRVG